MKRLFLALALVAAFVPVPAFAAGCDGVTVVVDYRGLGGGVQQGCAPGTPASGVAALTAAGFGYTYASRQAGFVCRIGGRPGTDADKCVNASPATAYWSYWHAPAGGSWSYSNQGAATYVPARGTVEGWAFGAGEQPGIAPPAAPAPPAPRQPAPPQPPAGQPPAQRPPAVTTTATTTAPPASSSAATPSSPESAPPSSTTASSVETSVPAVAEKAQQVEEKSGPSWLWTLLGVLVIAALVVAGLLVARRRRAAEDA
ncbi:hypothetical protein [Lentzea flaviverrucosa]|uniref:LPXTG-motif cell wall anchor domain-containing protein n=1 Tax=Lentzea flaviverrucosa TaxID=200379 RepID=A0A1H9VL14_9PSEU|nr:hypothetical protein [Lentzea flaviverrucosa]RDI23779.1 hypothetical protein DFR72_110185 [Lentzea flaviverrucosa]SES22415.1 hypothetical protein SAMN05216195_110151 [Lentzea flaviverrucosa]